MAASLVVKLDDVLATHTHVVGHYIGVLSRVHPEQALRRSVEALRLRQPAVLLVADGVAGDQLVVDVLDEASRM
jgi:hypothetical protein